VHVSGGVFIVREAMLERICGRAAAAQVFMHS